MVRIRKKSYKVRELKKALKKVDRRFEFVEGRGKGSHLYIYHPTRNHGRPVSTTVACHGQGYDLGPTSIERIMETFGIPEGVL